jgi:hypothetical protein
MAKKSEHDMTPMQVAQVATERHQQFHAWAASVAETIVTSSLGEKLMEKMRKNNAVELENLENAIAQHLFVCSNKPTSGFNCLTDEQKLAALKYTGPEAHG